jgi:hypothetical protein
MSLDERDQRLLIHCLRRDTTCECPGKRFQCLRCEMLAVLRKAWPEQYRQVLEINAGLKGEE